ncbi:MAG: Uma2 family endonuclease [Chitinophagaceae bacterium]|jgi:Uma2 family endonuclease|nr:Uma2 family endonuclease [Chitinophagaceae bacterium]
MSQYIYDINELNLDNSYTYADYLLWRFKERVELIKGKILKMSPAPARIHQYISQNINIVLYKYFENNPCQLYYAPFDVRLPNKKKSTKEKEIFTVVQPDLCVICDINKLDDNGCIGAPDLIVEILSPGNSQKEMNIKFNLYEEAGVQEYWLVYPAEKSINIFTLQDGKYIGLKPYSETEILKSKLFPDLEMDVSKVFA